MLVIVINCLRLFVVVIYCYHGNGVLLSATYRLLFWKRCFNLVVQLARFFCLYISGVDVCRNVLRNSK